MSSRRPIVIAYDVSCNEHRGKILRILKNWRLDGQKSVHECLLTPTEAEELFLQISQHINIKTDVLLFAWLEPKRKVLCRGTGKNAISSTLWHVR